MDNAVYMKFQYFDGKNTFMNVRLSPVCGLITDRPSTMTAEVNYLQGPLHWESSITHTPRRYQCLASQYRTHCISFIEYLWHATPTVK